MKEEKDLLSKGEFFTKEMRKKGITVDLVQGGLEKETHKAANNLNANLVILGREQKKKNIFTLSAKSIKRKMAEKCHYSILFMN